MKIILNIVIFFLILSMILGLLKNFLINKTWFREFKWNIIESDWGVLKQNFFLEYHQARSMHGIFRHYCFAISAYVLQCRLKSSLRLKTRI